MTTLKEQAEAYKPKQNLNIAELEEIPINLVVEDRTGTNADGNEFSYRVAIHKEKEYRVPNIVLEQIQTILKLRPTTTKINVKRFGSGLTTKYKTEPLD